LRDRDSGAEAEANSGLPPDRRLEFRMAINLGDVIVEGAISMALVVISPLACRPLPSPAA